MTSGLPARAVCLDAGGVLHLPRWNDLIDLLASLGLRRSVEDFDRAHYRGMAALDEHLTQDGRPEGFAAAETARRDAVATALGLQGWALEAFLEGLVRAETIDGPWRWVRPVPGALDMVAALRGMGLPVAVVSNADPTLAERLAVGGFDLPQGTVIASEVVGIAKPDPGIFELALKQLDVPPYAALHVGDSAFYDVAGARSAGIRGAHLDPLGVCLADDHPHVSSVLEILELVS